jgi:hypothetical protein
VGDVIPDHSPNIGQGPEFDAKEARWREEIAAAFARFPAAAASVMGLDTKEARRAALDLYRGQHGDIAANTLQDYIEWLWAGRPKDFTPSRLAP